MPPPPNLLDRDGASPWRFFACPLTLWLAAFCLRLLAILALDTPGETVGATPWDWGAEQACLADSLARGDGFGDPWGHGTGTSAWLTPVYASIVALLLKTAGGFGPTAAWILFLIQSAFDAATAWLLVRLGRHLGRPGAGLLAGWLWVFNPLAIWHAVNTVWDTTFVAFGFALFLERWFARVDGERRGAVAVAGLLFGALLFLNPAPQGVLPVLVVALVLGRPPNVALTRVAVFLGATLVVTFPWMLRNRLALGTWQLRPNLGVELMIGNRDGAHGHPVAVEAHPSHIEEERARYLELGEVAYSAECARRARDWVFDHPARFARLTAKRVQLFWVGRSPLTDPRRTGGESPRGDPKSWLKWIAFLVTGAAGLAGLVLGGLERRRAVFLGAILLLFGSPYYLTHVSERYRFPVDPILVLGAALLLQRLGGRRPMR